MVEGLGANLSSFVLSEVEGRFCSAGRGPTGREGNPFDVTK